ncbi:MAG TPA: DUF4920 domain-containing protein [Pyrinomonadaceae bacterium]|nr:DUF4920 domain-containing protein [Pyrinomonadaceae bacterium]
MKKILGLTILTLALTSVGLAQSSKTTDNKSIGKISERKPFEYDNESTLDANGVLKRGDLVGKAKAVSLAKVLKKPGDYVGKTVLIKGVIVRSCKMEGCWMELAPTVNAKSVRITFKNHAFFIPLDSARMQAKAEGVFSVKTLRKAEVDHLVNEDGAKFDNVNKDGTVTEVSFEATGVELTKK